MTGLLFIPNGLITNARRNASSFTQRQGGVILLAYCSESCALRNFKVFLGAFLAVYFAFNAFVYAKQRLVIAQARFHLIYMDQIL